MHKLKLPPFQYKVKEANGKVWIFDGIRKKYVVLTPEEWVRQHFIHYLIDQLKYPKPLIKVEAGLKYNQQLKRCDILVYNREGKPWMVVECKSPDVDLDEKTAYQVSVYNKTLTADYVAITNGIRNYCFEVSDTVRSLKDFPAFE